MLFPNNSWKYCTAYVDSTQDRLQGVVGEGKGVASGVGGGHPRIYPHQAELRAQRPPHFSTLVPVAHLEGAAVQNSRHRLGAGVVHCLTNLTVFF